MHLSSSDRVPCVRVCRQCRARAIDRCNGPTDRPRFCDRRDRNVQRFPIFEESRSLFLAILASSTVDRQLDSRSSNCTSGIRLTDFQGSKAALQQVDSHPEANYFHFFVRLLLQVVLLQLKKLFCNVHFDARKPQIPQSSSSHPQKQQRKKVSNLVLGTPKSESGVCKMRFTRDVTSRLDADLNSLFSVSL